MQYEAPKLIAMNDVVQTSSYNCRNGGTPQNSCLGGRSAGTNVCQLGCSALYYYSGGPDPRFDTTPTPGPTGANGNV